jgi:hypothetical protein
VIEEQPDELIKGITRVFQFSVSNEITYFRQFFAVGVDF